MRKRLALAGALGGVVFLCSFAPGAEVTLYQVDLVPTGKMIAKDEPMLKGTNYLFHQYPTGTLVSVRKSTVKQITKMSPQAVKAADPMAQVTRIRDLPMQGPKTAATGGGGRRTTVIDRARSAASAANAGTAARTGN